MKIRTTRFGEVAIERDEVLQFEHGLPGFEDERAFVIVPYDEESPFVFLQSAKTPDLAFLLTNPFLFFPTYAFEIDDDALAQLGIAQERELLVYGIVTVPQGRVADMTVNLLAPLVVNVRNRRGRQIVLEKSQYHTKHRLLEERPEERGKEDR